jgi:hypothetical protein
MRRMSDPQDQFAAAMRTLFEGFMMALAKKTGRRPSMAERA